MFEHVTNEQTTTSSSNNASTEPQPPPIKKANGLSKILGQCLGQTHRLSIASSLKDQLKQELDWYISHPHLDVEESPMEWWKAESSRYPYVAQLARKYLCLCATSVLSERGFSCGGILFQIKDHVLSQIK